MRRTFPLRHIILTFCAVLMICATGSAFRDIGTSPYSEAIIDLQRKNILKGYGDGTFRPQATITRAEFILLVLKIASPDSKTPSDLRCFKDLEVKVPQWYAPSVCRAQALGIIKGYPDRTFRPHQSISLAEGLTIALRALKFELTPPKKNEQWYEPSIQIARNTHLLLPLLKTPHHHLLREEAAELLYRLSLIKEQSSSQQSSSNLSSICGNGKLEAPEQCDDGNTNDSDGCSSICILVDEPVRRSILLIEQQSTGTVSNLSRGRKSVPLLRFTATVGRQDALLTHLDFKPRIGSLSFASNYTLAMDRDGDGSYETTVQVLPKVSGTSLSFDAIGTKGVLLPVEITVPFEVRADLIDTLGPSQLGIEFAKDDPGYIEAIGSSDGILLTGIETDNICTASLCWIRVHTLTTATNIAISERGSLFVTEHLPKAMSSFALAGSTTNPLLSLRLAAEGEDIDVLLLEFDGVGTSIDALVLTNRDGTAMSTATASQCSSGAPAGTFCADLRAHPLTVSTDTDMFIKVLGRAKRDIDGAISGESFRVSLRGSLSRPSVTARGRGTLSMLEQNDGDSSSEGEIFIGTSSPTSNASIVGAYHDIAFAKFGSITNASTVSMEYSIPVGLSAIGSFRLTALPHSNTFGSNHDLILTSITFEVQAQNVSLDPLGFSLSTGGGETLRAPCSASASTGTITVICSGLSSTEVLHQIPQGNSLVLRLYGNITNSELVPGSSAVLTTRIPLLGDRTQSNSILWSDGSTNFTWVESSEPTVGSTVWRRR